MVNSYWSAVSDSIDLAFVLNVNLYNETYEASQVMHIERPVTCLISEKV